MVSAGSLPARSVRVSRSMVMICDTLATESFGSPLARLATRTFPGAPSSLRFDVSTTAIAVSMRLRLKESAWTITSGRRNPGSEPEVVQSPRTTWPSNKRPVHGERKAGPGNSISSDCEEQPVRGEYLLPSPSSRRCRGANPILVPQPRRCSSGAARRACASAFPASHPRRLCPPP